MADAPLFIILDCRQVSHVDATGARTFGALVAELSARGINIMFAGGAAGGAAQGEEGGQGGVLKALVIGFINVTVGLPSLIALAAIVFKAPVYAAYLGALCKFLFLAAGVHQLVFVLLSSQPFAIGQVQDVGLIFLSAMASSVAVIGAELGLTPEVM
ncbi:STAS domain-containing protein, partial [Haematococcus lacustris]